MMFLQCKYYKYVVPVLLFWRNDHPFTVTYAFWLYFVSNGTCHLYLLAGMTIQCSGCVTGVYDIWLETFVSELDSWHNIQAYKAIVWCACEM